jgi:glycerol uptake facilitator-like aquaporin
MGIGHAAVALSASRGAPQINVGILIFAAFLADFLLGIFAAFGLEQAHIPPNYAIRHYLTFTFPYSHGLAALLLWSAIFAALVCWAQKGDRQRLFLVISGLVLSHFVLDALVHVPELPLVGESSPKIGLSLWNHLPAELTLETAMVVCGLMFYWTSKGTTNAARWGMLAFFSVFAALMWTQLWSTTAPTPSQLVPTWIIAPILLAAIPYGLDRKRVNIAKLTFSSHP